MSHPLVEISVFGALGRPYSQSCYWVSQLKPCLPLSLTSLYSVSTFHLFFFPPFATSLTLPHNSIHPILLRLSPPAPSALLSASLQAPHLSRPIEENLTKWCGGPLVWLALSSPQHIFFAFFLCFYFYLPPILFPLFHFICHKKWGNPFVSSVLKVKRRHFHKLLISSNS